MPRTVASLLTDKFGTLSTPRTNPLGVASIGTTAVKVLSNNPNRFEWTFSNLSPNTIYLFFDSTVSTSNGYVASPSGGFVRCYWEEDGERVGYEVWAIANGAASSFLVEEIVSAHG